jgi:hypothetical protein
MFFLGKHSWQKYKELEIGVDMAYLKNSKKPMWLKWHRQEEEYR